MEELHFNADITGERIDKFLDGRIESLSRSYIQKLIKEKKILVNQLPVKANYKLTTGDTIILQIPDPEPLDIQPENIPLDILYEERGTAKSLTEIKPVARPMSNIQRMQKVMRVIDEDIRPRLAQDGGDIELVDMEGTKVVFAMRGACSSSRASPLTIKDLVEKTLREQVDPSITVVEA